MYSIRVLTVVDSVKSFYIPPLEMVYAAFLPWSIRVIYMRHMAFSFGLMLVQVWSFLCQLPTQLLVLQSTVLKCRHCVPRLCVSASLNKFLYLRMSIVFYHVTVLVFCCTVKPLRLVSCTGIWLGFALDIFEVVIFWLNPCKKTSTVHRRRKLVRSWLFVLTLTIVKALRLCLVDQVDCQLSWVLINPHDFCNDLLILNIKQQLFKKKTQ